MKKRLVLGLIVPLGLASLLAACSDDDMGGMDHDNDDSSETTTEEAASADFNDADVTFAQGMIPHHQQAVEMATLAETRAEDPQVIDLAERIKGAQDPEIEEMQGWLEEWGQDEMSDDMGDHDMSGMMSDEDMAGLDDASGAEFDEMFLTMMIEHHEGAIEMAQTELDDGENAEAQELAQAIIDAQQAEIEEMQGILDAA